MASNREEFKRVMGRIGAVLMIGTMTVFTFTGCGNEAKQPVEQVTMAETEDIYEKEGNAIANDIDLTQDEVETDGSESEGFNVKAETVEQETVEQKVVEYNIDFINAANEDITVEENTETVIPEFEAENFYEILARNLNGNFEVREDGVYYDNTLVSTDYEEKDNQIIAKNVSYSDELHYQVHYVVENEKVVAKDIIVGKGESGINYVIDKDELCLVDIQDVMGTDISDLELNLGKCIGWSDMDSLNEVKYEFNSNQTVESDMTLYPVYEQRMVSESSEGLTLDSEGNAIEVVVKDGKITYVGKENKEVDKDGKLIEKKAEPTRKTTSNKDNKGSQNNNKSNGENKESSTPLSQPQTPKENPQAENSSPNVESYVSTDDSLAAMAAEWGLPTAGGSWEELSGHSGAAALGLGVE